ncbi:hypothetical protein Tco_0873832 [Tanacetum coccineum]|uniref:Uncharacterized protein n=1 Tax=Tanacetum coccineum TaxID=301880 RepID=A0ABQ5BJY1_9ASTR
MLNKETSFPWSSRLLRYAKSRPNDVKTVPDTLHNKPIELTVATEIKQEEQMIKLFQTILSLLSLVFLMYIYAALQNCRESVVQDAVSQSGVQKLGNGNVVAARLR